MKTYSKNTLKKYCDQLRAEHDIIDGLHARIGYPPYWKRENSFESLCKTIIEQQVSLASARSVYERLNKYCGSLEPAVLATMDDNEYRGCGITRQKARYLKLLAEHILIDPDFFQDLERVDNITAKQKLISLKGIGNWTANVYLMIALNRIDVYPDFDVALIKSIGLEVFNDSQIDNDTAGRFVSKFAPLQSIACLYFYHAYILRKNVVFEP